MLRVFLAVISLATGLPAMGAVVHLNNGDRISGEILEDVGGVLRIKPAFSAELQIAREFVTEVKADQVEEPEKSFQAVAEALAETPPPKQREWESNLGLNSTFSRGNTNSQLINMLADYKLERERYRYNADFSSIREEKEGDKTKEQDRLNLGYNRLSSGKWFFAMNATLEQDPVALLDHRYSLNPALGYDIWNEDNRTLNVQLGAGYSAEQIDGEDESGSLVDWRLDYSQKVLNGAAKVFHNHKIYRNLQGRKNTVFNSQSGLRYDLNAHLFVNLQLNYDYDTKPAPGTDSEDLTFLVGAGMSL